MPIAIFGRVAVLAVGQLLPGARRLVVQEAENYLVGAVSDLLESRFRDQSRRLLDALEASNERGWKGP